MEQPVQHATQEALAQGLPPGRGSFSIVQARYTASLLKVTGRGVEIPRFVGEVEARLQIDALRIAGRFRRGFGWKEGRVKLPLGEIIRAGARGSHLELGLGREGQALQRVTLDMVTPQNAAELAGRLPAALPWPDDALPGARAARHGNYYMMWAPVLGIAAVVVVVVAVLMSRRMY